MSDLDPDFQTPSPNLAQDDPLRDTSLQQWADFVKAQHPDIAGKLLTDPAAAVNELANRGVPPPPPMPSSVRGYSNPMGDEVSGDADPFAPRPGVAAPPVKKVEGVPDPTRDQGPVRIDKGKPPPDYSQPPVQPAGPVQTAQAVSGDALNGAPPATDLSSRKKEKSKDESAMDDFAKTFGAIKAIQPPPVSPVGTPNPPHATPMKVPDIAQLLAHIGSIPHQTPVSTLGRLLVEGKA